jgi:transposase
MSLWIWQYVCTMTSHRNYLTAEALFFLSPQKPRHRQYEALRAYFVDDLPSEEVAKRFGYSPGSFRVLCSQFRHEFDHREYFFKDSEYGRKSAPKRDEVREAAIALRKQNFSVYDIQRELGERGVDISINALSVLLKEEGFARLPRRRDEERRAGVRPDTAPVADVRALDLSPRSFHTDFAGLFLFLPVIVKLDLDSVVEKACLPGSDMIPASCALRTFLALKLMGKERSSHVMDLVFDPGIALFAGLNTVPKRSFLSEYSSRVDPRRNIELMSGWAQAIEDTGFAFGNSFDLDFHSVPANTQSEPLDRHYISGRSRSQKGILSFLVRDARENVLCYANAGVPKPERADEILRFVEYWKERTGEYPEELVFDSQLTTQANLQELNGLGVRFITLRRRSKKMLAEIYSAHPAQWRRVNLPALTRQYRNPRVLEQQVNLKGYRGCLRQLYVMDLGHEEPTVLLTNCKEASTVQLVTRYAQRMLIEKGISEAIGFFHIDALSSMVGLKVDFDLQITLIASSLYRIMARRIGREYRSVTAKTLFRKLFDMPGDVTITEDEIIVEPVRRAHNPLLVASGLAHEYVRIPWLDAKELHIRFS